MPGCSSHVPSHVQGQDQEWNFQLVQLALQTLAEMAFPPVAEEVFVVGQQLMALTDASLEIVEGGLEISTCERLPPWVLSFPSESPLWGLVAEGVGRELM